MNNFRLISLINPAYVYNRIKAIRSLDELKEKAKDLIVLVLKIATFRYGEKYWEKKRQEKLTNYMDEINKIDEIGIHREMGEYYFGRKDYEKALKIYDRILELDKDNTAAYFRLGEMKYVKGEYEGAIENLKKAVEYDKNNEYACGILCNLYRQKKEYKKALELAKGNKKVESEIGTELALVYCEQGEIGCAIEEINKAIEYDKNNEYAFRISGNIFMQKKQYEKALKAYKRALELAKENKENGSVIYSKIVQIYLEQGKIDIAIEEVNKALEYNKNSSFAYSALGNIYMKKKEHEKALAEYKKALELAKGARKVESGVYSEIAQVYLGQGRYGLAVQEINKAVEHDKYNVFAYTTLGDVYIKQKEYEKALAEYKKAVGLAKENKENVSIIYTKIAEIYLSQGNYDIALEKVKKALESDKYNKFAYKLLGSIYWHERKYEAALCEFDKAVKLSGSDKECESGIYTKTAQIYFKQGKYSRGMSELNKSIELDPKNSMAHLLLGNGYKYQSKYEEALNEFSKAIRLAGDDKNAKEKIKYEIINLLGDANLNNSAKALEIAKKAIELNFADNAMVLNILTNELEIAQRKVKLKSKVRKLIVKLTNQCNLDCKMCLDRQIPKLEVSKKIEGEIKSLFPYLEHLEWLGGEVFLYPGFAGLMEEALKYPLKQRITTNSLLLTEEVAMKLVKNDILLTISIDGASKVVYEEIRRGARFEDLIGKLDMINRIRRKVNLEYKMTLNVVVMRSNYELLESFAEFARDHGFSNVNFEMIVENRNNQNIFIVNRDIKVLGRVRDAIDKIRKKYREYDIYFHTDIVNDMLTDSALAGYKDEITAGKKSEAGACAKAKICLAPWKTLDVKITGDVCPFVNGFCRRTVGNLNTQSMEEIWNGENMINYRKKILSGDIETVCTLKDVYKEIPCELLR